jgi:hypothetical protein
MIIAGYAVAEGRQPFINALNNHLIRQAVPQMLKL